MAEIHIINGPNLNLLGRRQPDLYGNQSFEAFFEALQKQYAEHRLFYYQSNHEGELIDYLHQVGFAAVGLILNAGAYTHTSIALADAVAAIAAPVVEVHISNIHAREAFRRQSYLSAVCKGSIVGLGLEGYRLALEYLLTCLEYK